MSNKNLMSNKNYKRTKSKEEVTEENGHTT